LILREVTLLCGYEAELAQKYFAEVEK